MLVMSNAGVGAGASAGRVVVAALSDRIVQQR